MALEKAMQLGMPYSTAFPQLPQSVNTSVIKLKKELHTTVKSETHSGFTSIKNNHNHNLHM